MADLEHRVTRLEERSETQTATMDYLRQDMGDLRRSVETLATELRREMHGLREDMDRRLDRTDGRINWLTGVVITGFVTVIGTIAGAFWGVLQIVR